MREFILLAPVNGALVAVGSRRHPTKEQATAEVHQIIASHSKIVVAEVVAHFRANVTAREYEPGEDVVKLLSSFRRG